MAKDKRPKQATVRRGAALARCRKLAERLLAMMNAHVDGEDQMRLWLELRLEMNRLASNAALEEWVALGLLPTEAAEALAEFCDTLPTGYYFDRIRDATKRPVFEPLKIFLTLTQPKKPRRRKPCPKCKKADGLGQRTAPKGNSVVRYYKCQSCGHTWHTATARTPS